MPPSINSIPPISLSILHQAESAFQLDVTPTGFPPARQRIGVNITFATGQRRLLSKSLDFDMPFEFFVRRVEGRIKGQHKLILAAAGGFLSLQELFPDFVFKDPRSAALVLTNGESVTISVDPKNKRYRVESDSYMVLGFGLSLLRKFAKTKLTTQDDVPLEPLMEIAQEHHKLRCQEVNLQRKLHTYVSELESVQKALIVRYEAATPEPLDDLTELLKSATEKLKGTSLTIMEVQRALLAAGARLEAALFTFELWLIARFDLSDDTAEVVMKYIPTYVVNCSPGWEECTVSGVAAMLRKLSGVKGPTTGTQLEFLADFELIVEGFETILRFFQSPKHTS
jgi:hypothetical protein